MTHTDYQMYTHNIFFRKYDEKLKPGYLINLSADWGYINSFLASGDLKFRHLLITLHTVWTQIRTDSMSVLIWIKTI